MAAKKPKLTKEQKEKLLAMLEDDDDTEESQADEHTEPEANAGTNQVIVFTGSPDDFFKHFKAASPADADMAEKSDEATQESDGEQEDQAKDEPQPKSRSRYFRKVVTMPNLVETITSVAQQHGVDPILALATAYQESRLNPRAVGDGGTSFGLYQLHRGGQLGEHSPDWAYNPANNANQALSVMGDVAREHPTWSPGEVAAASQRPANRSAYATNVNNYYRQIKAGTLKLNGGEPVPPPTGPGTPPGATPAGYGTAGMFGLPAPMSDAAYQTLGKFLTWTGLPNLAIRVFCGVLGVGALAFGVYLFASEGSS